MAEPLADQVTRKIDQAAELYQRLLIVVAPAGTGKTSSLHDVHERAGALLINVNLEISRRMLEWSAPTRPIRTAKKPVSTTPAIADWNMRQDLHEQRQSYAATT